MNNLLKKLKQLIPYFYALVSGAIMPFAFAPYEIGPASIVSVALLLWCLTKCTPSKAFLTGLCYGIGMFGLGVNWVYVSIHEHGNAAPALATFLTSLLILLLALFPALLSLSLIKYFPKNTTHRSLLIFPALWVIFEILRGWIFTGFPWLYVGYSQLQSHLGALAPVGGVWAVSWVTVLMGSLLYLIINYFYQGKENKKFRNSLFLGMFTLWIVAFTLNKFNWTEPTNQKLEVSLVQGNIAQLMRWDQQYVNQIVSQYATLTQTVLQSNLIVWPEGAIPIPLPESTSFFTDLNTLAQANNTAIIVGVPKELADKQHYTNALFGVGMVDPAHQIYQKEHLVPFGEYVPFEKLLRGTIAFFNLPMSSFVSGPSNQEPLVAQGYRFAPAICYEIAYPFFVRHMAKDADFILTVSNDAWFGKSIGPDQHLQIAQFRALEMGKYVIRATNTGFTAFIDPNGNIGSIAPQFEATVLTQTVSVMSGQTLWSRFGIWPLLVGLVLSMGAGFFFEVPSKKKK